MTTSEKIINWIESKLKANATIQGLLKNVNGFKIFYQSEGEQPPKAYIKFHTMTLADGDKDLQLQTDVVNVQLYFLSHSSIASDFKQVRLMSQAIYDIFNTVEDGNFKVVECSQSSELQYFDSITKAETFEASQLVSFMYINQN